jgi:hypothetical protein
VLHRDQDQW